MWREALLAQAVLRGRTIGYVHHPQLARFRSQASPLGAVGGALDSLIGHRVADASVHRFVTDVAGLLRGELAAS